MRVVVQRSLESSVSVDGKLINKIDSGLVILVGFTKGDAFSIVEKAVKKIINLRIFNDENGIMNKSIIDIGGEILLISQFTLYANTAKGNRPSYIDALNGHDAKILYEYFNEKLNETIKTKCGVFGADMIVNITNDGPTTIMMQF